MSETSNDRPEFDSYARDYDALLRDPIRERFASESRFFYERKIDVIRDFFRELNVDTRRMRWLDVGCGRGDLLRLGRSSFAASAGCDPSASMLESCSDVEVRPQLSIDRIPWNDAAFDFVTAVCVFHHVPLESRPSLIKEMQRVVRPEGVLCVIEHNPLNPVTRVVVARSPVDANASLLSARQTQRLVTQAGAHCIGTRYFLYLPETIHRHLAWLEDSFKKLPLGGQYSLFARPLGWRGILDASIR